MNVIKFFIITLFSLLFVSNAMAGCTNKISAYTKTINFGNVIVQRDVPPGTIVATQSTQGRVAIECAGSEPHIYKEQLTTGLSSFGNNVYNIGVNGFGIRISENGISGEFHHYFAMSIQGWTGGSAGSYTDETYTYKFEIIKTSDNATSGSLWTGPIAMTSMQNEFYIGTFSIGSGYLQIVQCRLTTPSLIFPIGDIPATAFNTALGTIPLAAQTTQNLGLNCDAGANINVSLSGTQNPDIANSSVLALTNQGSEGVASGVGVQLVYNGSPLAINGRLTLKNSPGGQESFPLTARYYQTKHAVTTGSANTSATLNITYQ